MARTPLEAAVEKYFVTEGQRRGCWVIKTEKLMTGFPDRMVLMPGGLCGFAEMKQEGKKPTGLQRSRMRMLQRLGFLVRLIDSREGVVGFYELLTEKGAE